MGYISEHDSEKENSVSSEVEMTPLGKLFSKFKKENVKTAKATPQHKKKEKPNMVIVNALGQVLQGKLKRKFVDNGESSEPNSSTSKKDYVVCKAK